MLGRAASPPHLAGMPTTRATPDLFAAAALPRGLQYRPEFLSRDEEGALLALFAELPFREATFREYTARRRVVFFGCDYDAALGEWREMPALPPLLCELRSKVALARGIEPGDYRHALVSEYRPGTPIGWHRDRPQYGSVAGVSLGSACRMRFRPHADRHDRAAVIALELAPRSLYFMSDDIRWQWQHSIPPTKALRYSVTFRTRA